jgi:hypothetical protein
MWGDRETPFLERVDSILGAPFLVYEQDEDGYSQIFQLCLLLRDILAAQVESGQPCDSWELWDGEQSLLGGSIKSQHMFMTFCSFLLAQ